jgi:hypothetical protein
MVVVGSVLIMVDTTRHMLLDHGGVIAQPEKIAMYNNDGSLSPVGQFCQRCTVVGLVMLLSGMLWFLDFPKKVYSAFSG